MKKKEFESNGSTHFMNHYVIEYKGAEYDVESDYYTREEKTAERVEREKIAEILSKHMFGSNTISHYEIEKAMKELNISIKE